MPDGTLVEMPDNPTPEQLSALRDITMRTNREAVASALMRGGKQVVRGAGNAAAMVLERGGLGTGQPPEAGAKNLLGGTPWGEALRKYMDEKIPEEPGIGNAALRGLGGGLPNPKMMVPGATGMAAAEAVKDFGPLVQMLAGATAGGMTAFAMGPKTAPSPQENLKRDTGILTNVGLNRAGPKTSGQTAANMAEDAATAYFKDARGNRTAMFESMVQGEKVRKGQVANIYSAAKQAAENIAKTGRGEQADAMMEAANRLVTGNGQTFIDDLQQLSLSLKNLKENPPSLNAPTGRQISSKDIADSVKALESALESVSPAFKSANTVYGYNSRMIDKAAEGPLGRIADKQPFQADPAPMGKLDAVISGSDPSQITQTMAALKASGANPEAIARALMEKKLNTGPANPSQRVFGGPGSSLEEQMSTLLMSGGRDPAAVRAPLDITDRMAANTKDAGGLRDTLSAGPGGVATRVVMRPNAIDRLRESENIRREITKVLKNASPEEVERLLQLSMFDPKIRAAITLMGAAQPAKQE